MATTATVTVSTILTTTITATAATASATSFKATPQGGILDHVLPNAYSSSNPITLFIIQAGIIIIFCRLLHYPLSYIGQPRVIAEVIGGILLGPSVLARIPGFKDAIFPTASIPVLNNAANLGLILFLFLIALELDVNLFTHNWRVALTVGLAGMILPFGLGVAIAYGIYYQFPSENPISFGVFALFVGTALAITAFPVLCRILSELRLLGSSVGVTVLAAGVGNDVVGWILLALCVALVNNSSGLTALWVLLVAVGWVLFLVYAVRPVFHWYLKRTGSIQNGPSQGVVTVTLLLVLTSAWFTSIIGIHAIFGGFLVGLICPHDGGFAIKLTEKIEDLVAALFLPLYFALSGLNTNLGLLNDGKTWGYVIAIIVIALAGKITGGTLAARANKLVWRESFTIGVLMSCKGLVELIVLNIGLEAKILSTKTFTMFVVMALVTTFITTPTVKGLYPPWYQKKLEAWKRGEIDWDGKPIGDSSPSESLKLNDSKIQRLLIYLRLDSLSSLFTFITLLGDEDEPTTALTDSEKDVDRRATSTGPAKRPLEVHALRILELTDRVSSVMKVTEADEFSRRDPVVNAFQTFSRLHDVAISSSVVVVPEDSYAKTVISSASDRGSDFALIPWSEVGSNTEDQAVPFHVSSRDRFNNRSHLEFIQSTLTMAVCDTGIFIGNHFCGMAQTRPTLPRTLSGISLGSQKGATLLPLADKSHHILFPFLGGEDDRAALRFVLQLARNPLVTITIAQFSLGSVGDDDISVVDVNKDVVRMEVTAQDAALLSNLHSSLSPRIASRIKVTEVAASTTTVLAKVLELAKEKTGGNPRNAGDLVIVGRRHSKMPAGSSSASPDQDMSKILGSLGEKMVLGDLKASVLVIQAAGKKASNAFE